MSATDIIGYTADAAMYCPECMRSKIDDLTVETADELDEHGIPLDLLDTEGNTIGPVFGDAETDTPASCDLCLEPIPTRVICYKDHPAIDCQCPECQPAQEETEPARYCLFCNRTVTGRDYLEHYDRDHRIIEGRILDRRKELELSRNRAAYG